MLKQNKSKLIVSSLIIFLPTLFGAALWNRLPAQIVTRFSWDGSADNWSGKPFVVFGLPPIFFAVHVFCIFCTLSDSVFMHIAHCNPVLDTRQFTAEISAELHCWAQIPLDTA